MSWKSKKKGQHGKSLDLPAFKRGSRFIFGVLLMAVAILFLPGFSEPTYPKPSGNINDYAGVLTKEDKNNLNALVDAVLKQTGVTFAVAIVDDHGDESIEMYSVKLYEKWGIGQKNEDKGLLVIASLKEGDLRMEVGYGLEPVITDARAGECLDKMTPFFKNGEYGRGLYAGLLHAAEYIAKDAGVTLRVKPLDSEYLIDSGGLSPFSLGWAIPLVFLLILLPVGFGVYFGVRGRRCPRCRSKLTVTDKVIQNATYQAGGIATRIYQCSVCGYRQEKTYKTHPLVRPPGGGGFPTVGGPGPFFGGGFGGRKSGGGFSGPRGFGGGRSGGGGASRKW